VSAADGGPGAAATIASRNKQLVAAMGDAERSETLESARAMLSPELFAMLERRAEARVAKHKSAASGAAAATAAAASSSETVSDAGGPGASGVSAVGVGSGGAALAREPWRIHDEESLSRAAAALPASERAKLEWAGVPASGGGSGGRGAASGGGGRAAGGATRPGPQRRSAVAAAVARATGEAAESVSGDGRGLGLTEAGDRTIGMSGGAGMRPGLMPLPEPDAGGVMADWDAFRVDLGGAHVPSWRGAEAGVCEGLHHHSGAATGREEAVTGGPAGLAGYTPRVLAGLCRSAAGPQRAMALLASAGMLRERRRGIEAWVGAVLGGGPGAGAPPLLRPRSVAPVWGRIALEASLGDPHATARHGALELLHALVCGGRGHGWADEALGGGTDGAAAGWRSSGAGAARALVESCGVSASSARLLPPLLRPHACPRGLKVAACASAGTGVEGIAARRALGVGGAGGVGAGPDAEAALAALPSSWRRGEGPGEDATAEAGEAEADTPRVPLVMTSSRRAAAPAGEVSIAEEQAEEEDDAVVSSWLGPGSSAAERDAARDPAWLLAGQPRGGDPSAAVAAPSSALLRAAARDLADPGASADAARLWCGVLEAAARRSLATAAALLAEPGLLAAVTDRCALRGTASPRMTSSDWEASAAGLRVLRALAAASRSSAERLAPSGSGEAAAVVRPLIAWSEACVAERAGEATGAVKSAGAATDAVATPGAATGAVERAGTARWSVGLARAAAEAASLARTLAAYGLGSALWPTVVRAGPMLAALRHRPERAADAAAQRAVWAWAAGLVEVARGAAADTAAPSSSDSGRAALSRQLAPLLPLAARAMTSSREGGWAALRRAGAAAFLAAHAETPAAAPRPDAEPAQAAPDGVDAPPDAAPSALLAALEPVDVLAASSAARTRLAAALLVHAVVPAARSWAGTDAARAVRGWEALAAPPANADAPTPSLPRDGRPLSVGETLCALDACSAHARLLAACCSALGSAATTSAAMGLVGGAAGGPSADDVTEAREAAAAAGARLAAAGASSAALPWACRALPGPVLALSAAAASASRRLLACAPAPGPGTCAAGLHLLESCLPGAEAEALWAVSRAVLSPAALAALPGGRATLPLALEWRAALNAPLRTLAGGETALNAAAAAAAGVPSAPASLAGSWPERPQRHPAPVEVLARCAVAARQSPFAAPPATAAASPGAAATTLTLVAAAADDGGAALVAAASSPQEAEAWWRGVIEASGAGRLRDAGMAASDDAEAWAPDRVGLPLPAAPLWWLARSAAAASAAEEAAPSATAEPGTSVDWGALLDASVRLAEATAEAEEGSAGSRRARAGRWHAIWACSGGGRATGRAGLPRRLVAAAARATLGGRAGPGSADAGVSAGGGAWCPRVRCAEALASAVGRQDDGGDDGDGGGAPAGTALVMLAAASAAQPCPVRSLGPRSALAALAAARAAAPGAATAAPGLGPAFAAWSDPVRGSEASIRAADAPRAGLAGLLAAATAVSGGSCAVCLPADPALLAAVRLAAAARGPISSPDVLGTPGAAVTPAAAAAADASAEAEALWGALRSASGLRRGRHAAPPPLPLSRLREAMAAPGPPGAAEGGDGSAAASLGRVPLYAASLALMAGLEAGRGRGAGAGPLPWAAAGRVRAAARLAALPGAGASAASLFLDTVAAVSAVRATAESGPLPCPVPPSAAPADTGAEPCAGAALRALLSGLEALPHPLSAPTSKAAAAVWALARTSEGDEAAAMTAAFGAVLSGALDSLDAAERAAAERALA